MSRYSTLRSAMTPPYKPAGERGSQPRRMANGPPRPPGNAAEEAPPRPIFPPVRTFVAAGVTGIEAQSRDHDEHMRGAHRRGVDAHPPARAGRPAADVVLRERVVLQDFRDGPDPGAVEQMAVRPQQHIALGVRNPRDLIERLGSDPRPPALAPGAAGSPRGPAWG